MGRGPTKAAAEATSASLDHIVVCAFYVLDLRAGAASRPGVHGGRFAERLRIVVCGLLPGGGSVAQFLSLRPRRGSRDGAMAAAASISPYTLRGAMRLLKGGKSHA